MNAPTRILTSLTLLTPALHAAPTARASTQRDTAPIEAAATGQEAQRSEPRDEEAAKEKKRLLHLANGQVLRGKTRLVGSSWEIAGKRPKRDPWTAIPVSSVVRVANERDVLKEARVRGKLARKGDLSSRAQYADWMIGEGLYQEAYDELEKILTADPDQEWGLRMLGKLPRLASIPSAGADEPTSRDVLLRVGAKGGAVQRELVSRELSNLEDSESLLEDLKAELKSTSIRRRAFAAHALRRVFPGEEVRHLTMRTVLDSCADVRKNCAYALKSVDEPGLVLPMLRALGSTNVEVRTNAAEALGTMGYSAAVEPLITHYAGLAAVQGSGAGVVPRSNIFVGRQFAYIQDFDVEVAQFQAVADPQINVAIEGSVLQGRVIGVRHSRNVYERSVVRQTLRQLTGADPGDRPADWQRWWDDNKSAFLDKVGATRAR